MFSFSNTNYGRNYLLSINDFVVCGIQHVGLFPGSKFCFIYLCVSFYISVILFWLLQHCFSLKSGSMIPSSLLFLYTLVFRMDFRIFHGTTKILELFILFLRNMPLEFWKRLHSICRLIWSVFFLASIYLFIPIGILMIWSLSIHEHEISLQLLVSASVFISVLLFLYIGLLRSWLNLFLFFSSFLCYCKSNCFLKLSLSYIEKPQRFGYWFCIL